MAVISLILLGIACRSHSQKAKATAVKDYLQNKPVNQPTADQLKEFSLTLTEKQELLKTNPSSITRLWDLAPKDNIDWNSWTDLLNYQGSEAAACTLLAHLYSTSDTQPSYGDSFITACSENDYESKIRLEWYKAIAIYHHTHGIVYNEKRYQFILALIEQKNFSNEQRIQFFDFLNKLNLPWFLTGINMQVSATNGVKDPSLLFVALAVGNSELVIWLMKNSPGLRLLECTVYTVPPTESHGQIGNINETFSTKMTPLEFGAMVSRLCK